MKFNSNEVNLNKEQYINLRLKDSLEYMKEVIDITSISHERIIRRLATELYTIFIDKKHLDSNGKKHALWTYVFEDLDVPEILSVQSLIHDSVDAVQQSGHRNVATLDRETYFATSLKLSDGAYKPVIINNRRVSVETFLSTTVLRLPKQSNRGHTNFTVKDIVNLIRNKESSHLISNLKDSDPFLLLEKLRERYLIILGLVEYTIAVSELYTKQSKCYFIKDDNRYSHILYRRYIEDPCGEVYPSFMFNQANGLPSSVMNFQLFRELRKGERFDLAGLGKMNIYVNDQHKLTFEIEDDPPIVTDSILKISPLQTDIDANLLSTLQHYHYWENYWAILDLTDSLVFNKKPEGVVEACIFECRANAWFKLGNMDQSKKIYIWLKGSPYFLANEAHSEHLSKMICTIEQLQKKEAAACE